MSCELGCDVRCPLRILARNLRENSLPIWQYELSNRAYGIEYDIWNRPEARGWVR